MDLYSKLREDTEAIWRAGVAAVTPEQLFAQRVELDGYELHIADVTARLKPGGRLIVVGGGKAAAAMAKAFVSRLRAGGFETLQVRCEGWLNCPEGTFEEPTLQLNGQIDLCAARPAGKNEPTAKAISGTERILQLVSSCGPDDVVITLISGGGSALLVLPHPEISLDDKQHVARLVAASGGDIEQLNTLRRCLSRVKAGGLARASNAGSLISVIISDVLGDPLEIIASGPTVLGVEPNPVEALNVLEALGLMEKPELKAVRDCLRQSARARDTALPKSGVSVGQVQHVVLGNNADAVDAAGQKAVQLGYRYAMQACRASEGDVMKYAEVAARAAQQLWEEPSIDCWLSGGEPTVKLPNNHSGKGGRNQQLVLAVARQLRSRGWPADEERAGALGILSGGTDGEDGPTDAAGGYIDASVLARAELAGVQLDDYVDRADAYHFLQKSGGLLLTGPTGTNVCDLRVILKRRH